MSEVGKKPVLIRVPMDLYDKLLRNSAKETAKRGRTVSVPSLIVEELAEAMNKPGKEYENG